MQVDNGNVMMFRKRRCRLLLQQTIHHLLKSSLPTVTRAGQPSSDLSLNRVGEVTEISTEHGMRNLKASPHIFRSSIHGFPSRSRRLTVVIIPQQPKTESREAVIISSPRTRNHGERSGRKSAIEGLSSSSLVKKRVFFSCAELSWGLSWGLSCGFSWGDGRDAGFSLPVSGA